MGEFKRKPKSKSKPKPKADLSLVYGLVAVGFVVVALVVVVTIVSRPSPPMAVAPTEPPPTPTFATPPPGLNTTPANAVVDYTPATLGANEKTKGGMPKGYEQIVAVALENGSFKAEIHGSLVREMACQAVLIAAEDEMGLATLDPAIGEQIPSGEDAPGPISLLITHHLTSESTVNGKQTPAELIYLIRISRPFGTRLLSPIPAKLHIAPENSTDTMIERIEALSRGTFAEFLPRAGFKKRGLDGTKDVYSLNGLEHHLDLLAQFAWVQQLRSQIRSRGETPETLSGLARAYANLGNLADTHWSVTSKAFKARALLYAQRMIAKHGATPYTLAHRAYANALVGRHAVALKAIEAARAAQGQAAPEWLDIIDAYCSYRPQSLERTTGTFGVCAPVEEI